MSEAMASEYSILEDAKASLRHASAIVKVLGDRVERYERDYDKERLRNAELEAQNETLTMKNDVLWNLCLSMRSALEKCDFADEVYLKALDNTLRKTGIEA